MIKSEGSSPHSGLVGAENLHQIRLHVRHQSTNLSCRGVFASAPPGGRPQHKPLSQPAEGLAALGCSAPLEAHVLVSVLFVRSRSVSDQDRSGGPTGP